MSDLLHSLRAATSKAPTPQRSYGYENPLVTAAKAQSEKNHKIRQAASDRRDKAAAHTPLEKAAHASGGRLITAPTFSTIRFHLWQTSETVATYVGSFNSREDARTWINRDFSFIGKGSFLSAQSGWYLDK